MKIALITGSAGLIGSEAVRFLSGHKFRVIGIDNDMRSYFFGKEASTHPTLNSLLADCPHFTNKSIDIRDFKAVFRIFNKYRQDIELIVHTAAQPSHDWAAREPLTDFTINANGTLNLLEAMRRYCPLAVFILTSTNKVYGDTPNSLPLVELPMRWELSKKHLYYKNGIDETMSIDNSKHSLFGVSKIAADILVQEYGRYFKMKTGVFRCGCLTGPQHSSVELHGFLAYLMKCAATKREYKIFGYKGKQVRDNIHSFDLVNAFYHFYRNPRHGEVYNMGGSRFSNCSLIEAVKISERITGNKMNTHYIRQNRSGDHIWWISDVAKFKSHYPQWGFTKNVEQILNEIYLYNKEKWLR